MDRGWTYGKRERGGVKMNEKYILVSMRTMAWERAKGELRSVIHTYWSNEGREHEELRDVAHKIGEFIQEMEDEIGIV